MTDASLEHQLRYKTEADVPESTRTRLTNLAEEIFHADIEMQKIYEKISEIE